jgi:hypothetical protein
MATPPKLVEIDGFFVEITEAPGVSAPALSDAGPRYRGADALERTSARDGDEMLERSGGRVEAVIERVSDLRGTIANVCGHVRSAFKEANHPDELKVSFGIKLGGELGVPFVSRGTGEASIIVEATWKKAE